MPKYLGACGKWRVGQRVGLTGARARPNPTPKLDDEGNIDRKVSVRGEEIEEGKRDEPRRSENGAGRKNATLTSFSGGCCTFQGTTQIMRR